jgi:hypothetical protein
VLPPAAKQAALTGNRYRVQRRCRRLLLGHTSVSAAAGLLRGAARVELNVGLDVARLV